MPAAPAVYPDGRRGRGRVWRIGAGGPHGSASFAPHPLALAPDVRGPAGPRGVLRRSAAGSSPRHRGPGAGRTARAGVSPNLPSELPVPRSVPRHPVRDGGEVHPGRRRASVQGGDVRAVRLPRRVPQGGPLCHVGPEVATAVGSLGRAVRRNAGTAVGPLRNGSHRRRSGVPLQDVRERAGHARSLEEASHAGPSGSVATPRRCPCHPPGGASVQRLRVRVCGSVPAADPDRRRSRAAGHGHV